MIGGACRVCGVDHQPEEVESLKFKSADSSGTQLRVREGRWKGLQGTFWSWTRYGGPLSVRVRFARGVLYPDEPYIDRENFQPCELEVVP